MARKTNGAGVTYDANYVLGGNYSDVITSTGTQSYSGGKLVFTDRNAESTSGNDTLAGGIGDDTIYAGAGDDTLWGDSFSNSDGNDNGQDTLYGEASNDVLHGGNAKDYLDGGIDNDALDGDNGTDILIGGLGADDLFGGNAGDVFRYASFTESMSNGELPNSWNRASNELPAVGSTATGDWIKDFTTGEDKIDPAALNSQTIGTGAPDRLIFNAVDNKYACRFPLRADPGFSSRSDPGGYGVPQCGGGSSGGIFLS